MIVVDTSVWVAATRSKAAREASVLGRLIAADEVCLALPVRLELLSGVSQTDRPSFRRALSALPVTVPTDDTWRLLEGWVEHAANAGQRFSITDLLIAALAHELTALVWSLDHDFERMATLGFVQPYQ